MKIAVAIALASILAATASAAAPKPAESCPAELARYQKALPLYKSELAEAKRLLLESCTFARMGNYRSPLCDAVIAGQRCSADRKCAIP